MAEPEVFQAVQRALEATGNWPPPRRGEVIPGLEGMPLADVQRMHRNALNVIRAFRAALADRAAPWPRLIRYMRQGADDSTPYDTPLPVSHEMAAHLLGVWETMAVTLQLRLQDMTN